MSVRLLFTLAFFVLAVGCKNACKEVGCLHGNCVDGECVCDINHTGSDCSQCAADWGGTRCQINMSTYLGGYHVIGRSQFSNPLDTPPHPATYIDDTFEVVRIAGYNNALSFDSRMLDLSEFSADTALWARFRWGANSYTAYLSFKKSFDDSLFYYKYTGGLGAGTTTNLTGVKIE